MAVFSRIKTWVSNEVLTAADLNGEFNNIISNMQPSGIEDASASVADMQATTNPGGSGTESLATDLLGEIKRLRYVVQRLVGTYWYSTPVGTLTTGGVVTAALADGSVTPAKKAALGQQISSSSGSFTNASGSAVDVTNLSVTITTTGRPVYVGLIGDSNSVVSAYTTTTAISVSCMFIFDRNGSTISSQFLQARNGSSSVFINISVPASSFNFIDTPAAGTYIYKFRLNSQSVNNTGEVVGAKLIAYEL